MTHRFAVGLFTFCLAPCLLSAGPAGADTEAPADVSRTVHVHDTTVQPFLLLANGKGFGDPFPVYWDGVWHLYALQQDLRAVPHLTSTDLVKWREHEPAMSGRGIATGTVLRHEDKHFLFYTDARPQTIRVVVSDNPWRFDIAQSRLVVRADKKVYELTKGKFRDCYVFYHEQDNLWWMLVEATSEGAVAIGRFTSPDLQNWTQHEPILIDKTRRHGSCPQVIPLDSGWYLTLLDYATWYYKADSLNGPWELGGFYHTKRLTAASRWATDGRRHLGWGFFTRHGTPEKKRSGYGGPLGVGRELIFCADGSLGVRPLPELIAALRKPDGNEDLLECARTFRGKWEIDAEKQALRCEEEGGVLLFDLPAENADYYFEAEIAFAAPTVKADVIVRCSQDFKEGYRVALNPAAKNIAIRQFDPDGGVFDERQHAFAGASARLQVFVCDGQMEVFVDGQSSLSTRIVNRDEHRIAIEVAGGAATVAQPLLHYFGMR